MTTAIRIRCTDPNGNVAYIHRRGGKYSRCTLANGITAGFFYAGISGDEMACRLELDDCRTNADALAILERRGSSGFRYAIAEADTTQPDMRAGSGLYLRLFHGRRDPQEPLDDWGSEGPIIGPLAYIHTTYMCDVKFAASRDVMECFFPAVIEDWRSRGCSNANLSICDWHLQVVDDLILYDGIYYGDWSISLESTSSARASLPESAPSA